MNWRIFAFHLEIFDYLQQPSTPHVQEPLSPPAILPAAGTLASATPVSSSCGCVLDEIAVPQYDVQFTPGRVGGVAQSGRALTGSGEADRQHGVKSVSVDGDAQSFLDAEVALEDITEENIREVARALNLEVRELPDFKANSNRFLFEPDVKTHEYLVSTEILRRQLREIEPGNFY